MVKRKTILSFSAVILLGLIVWVLRPTTNISEHYGIWSLLPASVTIIFCFITRNVLLALFLGIFSAGLVSGQLNIVDEFLVPSLGSKNYAQMLLVYLWALGALLGLWNRNGGSRYFAQTLASKFVKSRISAKVFTWFMGIVFHQGGTISTVLTGTTVKPIADEHGVAHEELAYVVDSTASPVATLIPFNVWPVYVAGLITIEPLAAIIADEEAAIALFFMAIPFNFYAMIAITMTFLFAFDRLPLFGTPMANVVKRVRNSGQLDAPGSAPLVSKELSVSNVPTDYTPAMIDFLAPIFSDK